MALSQTIDHILDINRRRKALSAAPDYAKSQEAIEEELKVLNRIADQQARLLRKYEMNMAQSNS